MAGMEHEGSSMGVVVVWLILAGGGGVMTYQEDNCIWSVNTTPTAPPRPAK